MKTKYRVFYGWSKINKVRKRKALSVIFENGHQDEARTQNFIGRMQNTVYTRYQSEEEAKETIGAIRMFTEYSLFLDLPRYGGDVNKILEANFIADKNHVSKAERENIRKILKEAYVFTYGEKIPTIKPQQLQLF